MITINVLSALVGVIVVIMIIVGGIQYSAAGDDPQKVAAAKSKITNALLALFLFIFMYALLQWLVPGGIF
jgi:Na+/phosphate symporter